MYNEQMEALISAALTDGVLTEKEKQILFKKAESMGIDLDELEMVLDARLVELKKQEARQTEQHELEMEKIKAAQKSAPKSDKYGDVRKCPACGAMVESFQTKCPECGYEFKNIEASSTTKKLLKAMEELDQQAASSKGAVGSALSGIARVLGSDSLTARKVQLIRTFPIPNTKEDLLEMLSLSNANSTASPNSNNSEKTIASAWQEKTKQLIIKAKISLKDDPDLEYILSEIEREKKKRIKKQILLVGVPIALFILLCIIFPLLPVGGINLVHT